MKPVDEGHAETTVELSKAELELVQGGAEGIGLGIVSGMTLGGKAK